MILLGVLFPAYFVASGYPCFGGFGFSFPVVVLAKSRIVEVNDARTSSRVHAVPLIAHTTLGLEEGPAPLMAVPIRQTQGRCLIGPKVDQLVRFAPHTTVFQLRQYHKRN